MYSNDDNGAWFSAIARTHLIAGLGETRGQDFFTARATGELVPYLHHPPLPGLLLAGVFGLTGNDSPVVARATFAFMHVLTFLVIAFLAHQLWGREAHDLLYACVLAIVAVVPMSNFYGKMPNHEVPGLLFFIAGVAVWGFLENAEARWRTALAMLFWALALFASWHAAFCIVAWLLMRWDRENRWRTPLTLLAVLFVFGLILLQLLWASGWQLGSSQSESLGHWSFFASGSSLMDAISSLQHALGVGIGRYAYLPAVLAIVWVGWVIKDRFWSHKPLSMQQRSLLGLCLGSVAYAVLFPRAVRNHAYQGFYLIPFVALAASVVIDRCCGCRPSGKQPRRGPLVGLVLLLLIVVLGVATTAHMYRKASSHAVKAAADIQAQYR